MLANLKLIAATLLAPAAVAVLVAWPCRRLLPEGGASRYWLALGLASGFAVGYFLLPEWAPLVPARHWQWLPYLGLGAAIVGPVSVLAGVAWWERLLLVGALGLVAAWLIVPTWETLQPPRAALVPLVAAYLLLVAGGLAALPDRLLGRAFVALLAASAFAGATAIALATSFKYGQVAALGAAALGGSSLATVLLRSPGGAIATSCRAIAPVYAVLAGGMGLVGGIELEPPAPVLLLAPAAPLLLWILAVPPLARWEGSKLLIVQCVLVFVVLAAVVGWAAVGR